MVHHIFKKTVLQQICSTIQNHFFIHCIITKLFVFGGMKLTAHFLRFSTYSAEAILELDVDLSIVSFPPLEL